MATHYRQTHTGSHSILVQQEHSYTCQKHYKTKQIMNGRPQLCQDHHNGCWCLSLEKAFTVNAVAQTAINSLLRKHVLNHQNTDGISHSHSRSRHSVLRKERGRRRVHLKHFLSNFKGCICGDDAGSLSSISDGLGHRWHPGDEPVQFIMLSIMPFTVGKYQTYGIFNTAS